MPGYPDWMRIWYRRPQWRDVGDYTRQLNDEDIKPTRSRSPTQRQSTSIPNRLALERVLENKTCSPMSLHDFYMYLQHVEHSSENLEFYLWYKNYEANAPKTTIEDIAEAPGDDVPLPPGSAARPETQTSGVSSTSTTIAAKESISSISDSIMKAQPPCARLARPGVKWTDLFLDRPAEATTCTSERSLIKNPAPCVRRGTCPIDFNDEEKGAPAMPLAFTSQRAEERAELDAAIARFLVPGAEKELNISHLLRQRTLNKLQESGDPRHLKPVVDHIYEVMKNCSHRNFVALGVATGSYETICVGNLIGIMCVIGGFLLVLLRALYPHIGAHSRWEVFYSFPLWWVGVTVPLLGTQGMCSIMLSMSKRQPLPWEKYEDDRSVITHATSSAGPVRWWKRYRAFMNRTVAHDRHLRVEDKSLRRLQRMILCQCAAGGAVAACLCVLLFIFLPIWKETVR